MLICFIYKIINVNIIIVLFLLYNIIKINIFFKLINSANFNNKLAECVNVKPSELNITDIQGGHIVLLFFQRNFN